MRSAAAADTDVVDAQVAGRLGEVGHLEAVAQERFKRERKPAVSVSVLQRLEVRLRGGRPLWDRLGGDMTADRRPNPLQNRQHRPGTTRAIEPHYVRAPGLKLPAGFVEL